MNMVIVSPQDLWLWDPFQMAFSWLVNGGDENYLLTGVTLQVMLVDGDEKNYSLCVYRPEN